MSIAQLHSLGSRTLIVHTPRNTVDLQDVVPEASHATRLYMEMPGSVHMSADGASHAQQGQVTKLVAEGTACSVVGRVMCAVWSSSLTLQYATLSGVAAKCCQQWFLALLVNCSKVGFAFCSSCAVDCHGNALFGGTDTERDDTSFLQCSLGMLFGVIPTPKTDKEASAVEEVETTAFCWQRKVDEPLPAKPQQTRDSCVPAATNPTYRSLPLSAWE
eukprot:3812197-Amphidinium_carterae.1